MRPTLRQARQFELVYTQGRKSATSALVLFHLERAPDRRVAYVASRKVGNAVQRNRAKRVLRAALAEVERRWGPVEGWLILVARRETGELGSREVAAVLRRQLGSKPGSARAQPE
jgi:ribonuclease P protein component